MSGMARATGKPNPADGDYGSLHRGLEVLRLVQDRGAVTAKEIHHALGIPLSTVYRYVAVLKESGFAVDIDGMLVASERLSERWTASSRLVSLAAPILTSLRVVTGMTSVLAVRVHTAALCLDVSYAHPKHRIAFRRGQMRSLHAGASALVLLAYSPEPVISEVLSRGYREYTSSTLSPPVLREELKQIRQDGVSITVGQTTPGMMGVGVPVMSGGVCIASLTAVGESSRTTMSGSDLVEALKASALELRHEVDSRMRRSTPEN